MPPLSQDFFDRIKRLLTTMKPIRPGPPFLRAWWWHCGVKYQLHRLHDKLFRGNRNGKYWQPVWSGKFQNDSKWLKIGWCGFYCKLFWLCFKPLPQMLNLHYGNLNLLPTALIGHSKRQWCFRSPLVPDMWRKLCISAMGPGVDF